MYPHIQEDSNYKANCWAICGTLGMYVLSTYTPFFTSADTIYQPNGRTFAFPSILHQPYNVSMPPTLPLAILFLFLVLIVPIRPLVFQWRCVKCFVGFENDFSLSISVQ